MPRKPRSYTVEEGFFVFMTWRGHNKEWNIHLQADRRQYLRLLNLELAKQTNVVTAIVLMANHVHEIVLIKDCPSFSTLMRNHHARYGRYFNDQNERCGKVAQDRPHTGLTQDDGQAMTSTFYLLANPLRVNICKDLRNYYFSSYNFYAFGKKHREMPFLQYPDWYLTLGKNPKDRQRAFRRLFFDYLRKKGLISTHLSRLYFIGDPLWVEKKKQAGKNSFSTQVKKPPGP